MSTMPYTRTYHHELPANHECSDADIADILRELRDLDADTSLIRYEDPTEAEMQAMLTQAAAYTGPWYHSVVLFHMDPPVTENYHNLRRAIINLPASAGVSTTVSYEMPGLGSKFARQFHNS